MKWNDFTKWLRKSSAEYESQVDVNELWGGMESRVDALNNRGGLNKSLVAVFLAGLLLAGSTFIYLQLRPSNEYSSDTTLPSTIEKTQVIENVQEENAETGTFSEQLISEAKEGDLKDQFIINDVSSRDLSNSFSFAKDNNHLPERENSSAGDRKSRASSPAIPGIETVETAYDETRKIEQSPSIQANTSKEEQLFADHEESVEKEAINVNNKTSFTTSPFSIEENSGSKLNDEIINQEVITNLDKITKSPDDASVDTEAESAEQESNLEVQKENEDNDLSTGVSKDPISTEPSTTAGLDNSLDVNHNLGPGISFSNEEAVSFEMNNQTDNVTERSEADDLNQSGAEVAMLAVEEEVKTGQLESAKPIDKKKKKLCPNIGNYKGKRWEYYVGVEAGAAYPFRKLKLSGSGNEDLFVLRNERETSIAKINYGFAFTAVHPSGFNISSGFGFSTLLERYEFSGTKVETEMVTGVVSIAVNPLGDTIITMGEIPVTTTTEVNKKIYNKYNYFEIPVLVGYQRKVEDWTFGVQGGVSLGLITSAVGEIADAEGNEVSIFDLKDELFRTKFSANYYLGGKVAYNTRGGLSIYVSPNVRFSPHNVTSADYPVSTKYTFVGGTLGVAYKFGR
ncbi:MAG: hypothetical protein GY751_14665 [Bacteroidetes bacterium]|nr:hypothetical protein [Bacteroidota bacterium]